LTQKRRRKSKNGGERRTVSRKKKEGRGERISEKASAHSKAPQQVPLSQEDRLEIITLRKKESFFWKKENIFKSPKRGRRFRGQEVA